ncbi:MAG: M64 family metallopeptidase [Acidobacteriota bacterium]|nr:M64 family metallopeptidase [Acidobacteriota bacterium]MDW3229519.1 M64 family metallopeptidase [Acidobacteriota bacterium]
MKKYFILALGLLVIVLPIFSIKAEERPDFDRYFIDKTMRIDYYHVGDHQEELITLDRVYQQGVWAGPVKNLIDPFMRGRYCAKVYDAASGKLIFARGFDSLFAEYKTTDEGLKGIKRTFHESVLIPFPKSKIIFSLEVRDRENNFYKIFSEEIDPASIYIIKESFEPGIKVFELLKTGNPHDKVDVVFLAEGYRSEDEGKLKKDLERFTEVFFSLEPYQSQKDKFNLYGVFKPSTDSGCDEPSHGQYKQTSLGCSFDSFGSERYLLTEDNRRVRDIAARVPYDALLIMVNHSRYGGGGIYNLYCTFTTDNQWYEYLMLHEFGHSFTGLADEYYTSEVAYNEFYPRGVEPVEPNITALLNPAELKWKKLVSPGLEIPTPWEKEEFDRMDMAYQKIRQELNEKIARMKREGAPEEDIARLEEESEKLSLEQARKVDDFLARSRYAGKVGAFEGAGYSSTGLYRPAVDCLMFTKGKKPLCPVCRQAVSDMIKFFSR